MKLSNPTLMWRLSVKTKVVRLKIIITRMNTPHFEALHP